MDPPPTPDLSRSQACHRELVGLVTACTRLAALVAADPGTVHARRVVTAAWEVKGEADAIGRLPPLVTVLPRLVEQLVEVLQVVMRLHTARPSTDDSCADGGRVAAPVLGALFPLVGRHDDLRAAFATAGGLATVCPLAASDGPIREPALLVLYAFVGNGPDGEPSRQHRCFTLALACESSCGPSSGRFDHVTPHSQLTPRSSLAIMCIWVAFIEHGVWHPSHGADALACVRFVLNAVGRVDTLSQAAVQTTAWKLLACLMPLLTTTGMSDVGFAMVCAVVRSTAGLKLQDAAASRVLLHADQCLEQLEADGALDGDKHAISADLLLAAEEFVIFTAQLARGYAVVCKRRRLSAVSW